MDHEVVVREKITEKYLLEELDPQLRDEFEDHFFDCPECAFDVRAGTAFVQHSKAVLKESSAEEPEKNQVEARQGVKPANPGWFAWLRPAFAVPAMALLLAVIGIETMTLQHLSRRVSEPQILPAATLNLLTYGSNSAPLVIRPGQGFLLNVIVPPGHRYPAYRVDLYNRAGVLEASIPVKDSTEGTWPISFPPADRASGTYKLDVRSVTASGQDAEVGSSSFELQVQK
jgi:hypothetical protein